jgi:hypothetical protein
MALFFTYNFVRYSHGTCSWVKRRASHDTGGSRDAAHLTRTIASPQQCQSGPFLFSRLHGDIGDTIHIYIITIITIIITIIIIKMIIIII